MLGKTKKNITPDTFKFLRPEEIDNIIKIKIAALNDKSDNCWKESELMMRNQVIIDLIGQGLSRRRIQEEIMSRWGIVQSTANKYIREAYDVLLKGNEEFLEYNRDKQVERLENIITEAMEAHEYKAAVMATAELNKLLGLTTNQKITLENTDRVFKFGGEQ